MTPDPSSSDSFDVDVSTPEEFDAAIADLLAAAVENDVDPLGSWVARNGSEAPDFEVQISELVKDRP